MFFFIQVLWLPLTVQRHACLDWIGDSTIATMSAMFWMFVDRLKHYILMVLEL